MIRSIHLSEAQNLTDLHAVGTEALIVHILERYHATHRAQLPALILLAQRVEHVHRIHDACPKGLAAHLQYMQSELESHMNKEEQVLFPMIRRGLGSMAMGPISVMRAEHEDHGEAIQMLENLCPALPSDACATWRALSDGVGRLKQDLNEHINIENDVLFPRFSFQG